MNATKKNNDSTQNILCRPTQEVQSMLGCGYATAVKIGMAANAKITIGRRTLWNIEKIKSYLDSISK